MPPDPPSGSRLQDLRAPPLILPLLRHCSEPYLWKAFCLFNIHDFRCWVIYGASDVLTPIRLTGINRSRSVCMTSWKTFNISSKDCMDEKRPDQSADDLLNSQNYRHKTDIRVTFACNWTKFWNIVSNGLIFLLFGAILNIGTQDTFDFSVKILGLHFTNESLWTLDCYRPPGTANMRFMDFIFMRG